MLGSNDPDERGTDAGPWRRALRAIAEAPEGVTEQVLIERFGSIHTICNYYPDVVAVLEQSQLQC